MFKRSYFFKIESLPTLRASRLSSGKFTVVTGFVCLRSFFKQHVALKQSLIKKVASDYKDFNEGEIILTSLTRL